MYKFTISTDAAFIASDMFTRWQRGTQKFQVSTLCKKLAFSTHKYSHWLECTITVIWINTFYVFKQAYTGPIGPIPSMHWGKHNKLAVLLYFILLLTLTKLI